MRALSVVADYDFTPFSTIVDVGGGNGTLIATILNATPKLRGIVFDSPSGSAEATSQLQASGLLERCEVIAGDFFRSVPRGADAYILKSIIHDWDDERSVAILRNCREAISADGKSGELNNVRNVGWWVVTMATRQHYDPSIVLNWKASPRPGAVWECSHAYTCRRIWKLFGNVDPKAAALSIGLTIARAEVDPVCNGSISALRRTSGECVRPNRTRRRFVPP